MTDNIVLQRKNPFVGMKITNNEFLKDIKGRSNCTKCFESRKYFCYTCYIPVVELIGKFPNVRLPIKIDIIKHKYETDGKCTSAHAAILAPNDVTIYIYPNMPDYSKEKDVVLIYPSSLSVNVNQLFNCNENSKINNLSKVEHHNINESKTSNEMPHNSNTLPIKRAIFIDSTWNQSNGIYKDKRLNSLKTIILQNRLSQFWRHQKGKPIWYLATIEAIHQFLIELHINAWGLCPSYKGFENLQISIENITTKIVDQDKCNCFCNNNATINDSEAAIISKIPYNGEYDNLLFFFKHIHNLIHSYYDENKLKPHKRPFR